MQVACRHANGTDCQIAAGLAGVASVATRTDAACAACQRQVEPQSPNSVTVSLAVSHLRRTSPDAAAQLAQQHRDLLLDLRAAPGLLAQAWSLARAVAEFVAAGAQTVAPSTYEARLSVCDTCASRDNHRCAHCRCFVAAKAKLPANSCPLGHWNT